jgi:hypothetical protein
VVVDRLECLTGGAANNGKLKMRQIRTEVVRMVIPFQGHHSDSNRVLEGTSFVYYQLYYDGLCNHCIYFTILFSNVKRGVFDFERPLGMGVIGGLFSAKTNIAEIRVIDVKAFAIYFKSPHRNGGIRQ